MLVRVTAVMGTVFARARTRSVNFGVGNGPGGHLSLEVDSRTPVCLSHSCYCEVDLSQVQRFSLFPIYFHFSRIEFLIT